MRGLDVLCFLLRAANGQPTTYNTALSDRLEILGTSLVACFVGHALDPARSHEDVRCFARVQSLKAWFAETVALLRTAFRVYHQDLNNGH